MAKARRGKSKAKKTAKKNRPAARRVARKASQAASSRKKRPAKKRSALPKVRPGMITHTELASSDPRATKEWCETVLGWKFGTPMETPGGPYQMWRFTNNTGGGLRRNQPPETPGSIPYCEVPDIQAAYRKALAEGGTEMMSPSEIPGGMGWIAIVAAPGGVAIGFWGPK